MARFPMREERLRLRQERCLKREAWLAEQREAYWRDRASAGLADLPSIPEVFRGETVFVTGGSGFLGKLLIEKLLRSCPEVKRIYLLLRPKKGVPSQDRMKDSFSQELFQPLLQMFPDALKKVRIIEGDCALLGLGLSSQDRVKLQREVGFVFHSAASVRFEDPVKKAVLLNVRGTREMVELAKGMVNLKAFLHVSTSFCNGVNCEERVYEPCVDPDVLISAAERCDADQLSSMTHKLLSSQPNTYTFTKQIGEHVVNRARGEIPVITVRPSIVFPCAVDPLPGWMDNLNGPFGIAIVALKGILRCAWIDAKNSVNTVFADTVVRSMIVAAWLRTTNQKIDEGPDMDVLNVVNNDLRLVWADMHQMSDPAIRIAPVGNAIRYPRFSLTKSKVKFMVVTFFSHLLFGLIMDTFLRLIGKTPRLLAVYRTVHTAMFALAPFSVMSPYYEASTDLYWKALSRLKPEDTDAFHAILAYDEDAVLQGCMKYITLYRLNETYDAEKFKMQYSWLLIAEAVSWVLLGGIIVWLMYSFNLPSLTYRKMCSYSSKQGWVAIAEETIK